MKNTFKSLLLLIVIFILTISALISCSTSENDIIQENKDTAIVDSIFNLNGIDISKYVIIYSETDLDFNLHAAEYLRDIIKEELKTDIEIKTDTEVPESEHEILIGHTNRSESDDISKTKLESQQYILTSKGAKLVLYGREYAVAGAAYELGQSILKSLSDNGITISENTEIKSPEYQDPNNFILLICSGAGENTFKYGEVLYEKSVYTDLHDTSYSYMNLVNDLPNQGWCYTRPYDTDHKTDCAASATALATGYKTYNGVVGLNKYYQPVKNLTELASELGKSTAILTTGDIYNPVTAAFTSHIDIIDGNSDIDEILYQQQHGDVDLLFSNIRNTEKTLSNALSSLSENDNGFFMLYEESQIDAAVFNNSSKRMLYGAYVRTMTALRIFSEYMMYHPDTMLILTSDHEAGSLSLNESTGLYNIVDATHSTVNVPLCGIGKGTELLDGTTYDNTFVAKLIAKMMGVDNFGEPDTPETVDFSEAQPYTEQEKKEIKINQRDNKTNFSKYMTDEKEKRQQK